MCGAQQGKCHHTCLLVVHNDTTHQQAKTPGFQACPKFPLQKGLSRIGCFGSRTLAG